MEHVSRQTRASEPNINQDRPLSWHPTSFDQPFDFSQHSQVNFFPQFDVLTSTFTTAEINGLITPMSAPVPNEPQIREFLTPLEDCPPQTNPNIPFVDDYVSKMGTYYLPEQNYQAEDQMFVTEQVPYQYQYPMPLAYQLQPANYPHLNVDTAPPSPTLLPIRNFDNDDAASPFVLSSPRVEKDELVGMGLYDKPQDVQSNTLFGGGPTSMAALTAGIGKGLKLEESFEPPPAEDDEEEDDNDDNEETEENEEPEDLAASTATVTSNHMVPPEVYVEDQSDFSGQTFFLDDKDGHYAMPVAAGINYPYYQTSEWIPGNNQHYGWI